MKTVPVLTQLLPMIGAVRGSGAYNVVVQRQAPVLAERLRVAANDDRFVVTPLMEALGRLAAAEEFEEQQIAMAETLELADTLLGAISNGSVETAQRIAPTVSDLVKRLQKSVGDIRDVYSPGVAVIKQIRADAAELSVMVDSEIIEGRRDEDHAIIAAQIFDEADRLQSDDYAVRERMTMALVRDVARLAA